MHNHDEMVVLCNKKYLGTAHKLNGNPRINIAWPTVIKLGAQRPMIFHLKCDNCNHRNNAQATAERPGPVQHVLASVSLALVSCKDISFIKTKTKTKNMVE